VAVDTFLGYREQPRGAGATAPCRNKKHRGSGSSTILYRVAINRLSCFEDGQGHVRRYAPIRSVYDLADFEVRGKAAQHIRVLSAHSMLGL